MAEYGTPVLGESMRSMHGNGDDPQGFSHDEWVAVRNQLYGSNDVIEKELGKCMNFFQEHYFSEADSSIAKGRVFAEGACLKILNLRGDLGRHGYTLQTAIEHIGPLSPLNRPLKMLQRIGNQSGAIHFQEAGRVHRMRVNRSEVAKAIYEVADHIARARVGGAGPGVHAAPNFANRGAVPPGAGRTQLLSDRIKDEIVALSRKPNASRAEQDRLTADLQAQQEIERQRQDLEPRLERALNDGRFDEVTRLQRELARIGTSVRGNRQVKVQAAMRPIYGLVYGLVFVVYGFGYFLFITFVAIVYCNIPESKKVGDVTHQWRQDLPQPRPLHQAKAAVAVINAVVFRACWQFIERSCAGGWCLGVFPSHHSFKESDTYTWGTIICIIPFHCFYIFLWDMAADYISTVAERFVE